MGTPDPPRLLDRMSEALRTRHYSPRTEQVYVLWVKRYIRFHKMRHPKEMGEPEVNGFLTYLAVEQKVSASTQNQALAALLFLYRHVLGIEMGDLGTVVRARKSHHVPIVMTRAETRAVLAEMSGETKLMASLLYGSACGCRSVYACACRTSTWKAVRSSSSTAKGTRTASPCSRRA